MEGEPTEQQPPKTKMQGGAQPPQRKMNNAKRRQRHSADIVYTKGSTFQTTASLTSLLKGVTEPIIGLQYVWEFRSPSKSVQPHYQCKLCPVARLQHDMLTHLKGWKHSLRYLKRAHTDKVTYVEEEDVKDAALKSKIKETAAEVEKAEGRGQLKVIYREPNQVQVFKGFRSANPKVAPPVGPGIGFARPKLGGRLSDPLFPGEYPGGPLSDFPMGGISQGFSGPDMGPRRFSDGKGPRQGGGGDGFRLSGGRDGFGMGGLLGDGPERCYPDEFRGGLLGSSPMDRPMDRPIDRSIDRPGLMGAAPDCSSLPATLLKYLDTFCIENEGDAQIVLKVTQKLTDVLMDYRLRSVSAGPSMSSSMNNSSSSMGYSSPPSRRHSTGDRYSGSLSGPSRYSDSRSRFYN